MCLALFLEMACSNFCSSSSSSRSYFLFGLGFRLALDTNLQITLLVFSVVVGIGGVFGTFLVVIVVSCRGFFVGFCIVLEMAFDVFSTIPLSGRPS